MMENNIIILAERASLWSLVTLRHQGCYNKTVAMMSCHTKVITQLENDPIFKQAKTEAMQELDRCFQSNPLNAFDSLMMMMKKGDNTSTLRSSAISLAPI